MPFNRLTRICAALFLTLGLTLCFFPGLIYWLFAVPAHPTGDFLALRAAMLFLGFVLLCFFSRNTTSNEVKRLVAISVGGAMFFMALLGMFEFARGNAGAGISLAIAAEIAIAALFARHLKAAEDS